MKKKKLEQIRPRRRKSMPTFLVIFIISYYFLLFLIISYLTGTVNNPADKKTWWIRTLALPNFKLSESNTFL